MLHEEFILSETVQFDGLLECSHVARKVKFGIEEQASGEQGHLDVIEPIQTPLDLRVGEDLLQCLRDLSLHVDRFVTLHEFRDRLLGRLSVIRDLEGFCD